MLYRKMTVLASVCVLSACATGYHDASNLLLGYTGGYWEKKGPGKLTKVGFSGNGYITNARVGDYLVYRCAEVTKREGKSYFAMYPNLPAAILDRPEQQRKVGTLGGKADSFVYILMSDQPEAGMLSVQEVMVRMAADKTIPQSAARAAIKGDVQ